MKNMSDGIVTVHINGKRYRGAYQFAGGKLIVTAHGLNQSSADMAALGDDRGKAALNLAKLVLIDMVKNAIEVRKIDPGLCLQGSTTQLSY